MAVPTLTSTGSPLFREQTGKKHIPIARRIEPNSFAAGSVPIPTQMGHLLLFIKNLFFFFFLRDIYCCLLQILFIN